jgi:hypothetical protein
MEHQGLQVLQVLVVLMEQAVHPVQVEHQEQVVVQVLQEQVEHQV